MVRRGRDFDEDDVRVRANPRGSRPRTKIRPTREDAADAMVLAVDRGRYTCLIRSGERAGAEVTAMKARELGRKGVVVGDEVSLVGDLRGGPDALARVVRVQPRHHVLRRTADDTDPVERVIVANADQLVIVTALADPEPRPRMIDRCLVAALEAHMPAVLCLTKADLADPAPLEEAYRPLGVEVVVTRQGGDLTPLRRALAGKTSVLVGHSGVGKSTLVNALIPGAARVVGVVNDVTGRGRHTSTSAVALRLPATEVAAARAPEGAEEEAEPDAQSARSRGAASSAHPNGPASDARADDAHDPDFVTSDADGHLEGPNGVTSDADGHPEGPNGVTSDAHGHPEGPNGVKSDSHGRAHSPDGAAATTTASTTPDGATTTAASTTPDGAATTAATDQPGGAGVRPHGLDAAGAADDSSDRAFSSDCGPNPDGADDPHGTERLPGGWVIDTPGVRSFGLAHVSPNAVVDAFPDLAAITAECPRGCTHMADSPDCLLDEFPVDPARLDSLRRLLSALTSGD
jgi:ribosome biogenesis GTPase